MTIVPNSGMPPVWQALPTPYQPAPAGQGKNQGCGRYRRLAFVHLAIAKGSKAQRDGIGAQMSTLRYTVLSDPAAPQSPGTGSPWAR
jgi:hypothetical protein